MELSVFEIFIRVLIATCLGFVIGLERELTNKWAGLRTHILVCLGSAAFTIISIYGFPTLFSNAANGSLTMGDPARVAAQIITGIGFIGGGTVLRVGPSVLGLTTAASLWVTASIGMAIGTGSYLLGTITTIFTVVILVIIGRIEITTLKKYAVKSSKIKLSAICPKDFVPEITTFLEKNFRHISFVDKKNNDENNSFITVIFEATSISPITKVYKKLEDLKQLSTITVSEVENNS
ncbi:MAG: MgtC/SapB family protein [Candidatus Gastranaerophilales bacterium]|nr:MgtC/SapB family protein [Candidatus Gastranaerophilales bacterium]